MTNEIIWAAELFNLYRKTDLEDIRKRLFKVTDILVYIHEVLAGSELKFSEKDMYSEQLVLKFHLHNLSIIKISEGYTIESNFYKNLNSDIKFLDISSIMSIVRSQFENLLMYRKS
ncbi:hypothetical protein [Chryseobacterium sp. CFBP8996]|uniref:hypothetical protein n=1 Tax=Chryseobacterium sp. CFBP8996 TaxID=3096529 RepID=UPI002A6A2302|nr:hypothetical protein [Chryseobacterium sp. CFBP8996]MDY0931122.1 hypothetical protein [Chryseobacterium sp. CFBP8996]